MEETYATNMGVIYTMKPRVAILRTDGINCDEELFYAFKTAGGEPTMVHINELLDKKKRLNDYQILGLPGGFSYGDDILSAKVLANELRYRLHEQIDKFISKDKLIIGVCNGFQVLVRMGLLPWQMGAAKDVSLIFNDSGHFECRWIKLRITPSRCVFTRDLYGQILEMPTAHGEGKFVVKNDRIGERIKRDRHIAAQYVDENGNITKKYPDNPNGSHYSIAAATDSTGRIFGIMPHPERNILPHHHPNWRRLGLNNLETTTLSCQPIFQNAIDYFV